MSFVSINWKPTDRQLRQFAVATLAALPVLAWVWSRGNLAVVTAFGLAGAVLAAIGWRAPRTMRPVFLAMTLVMFPVGIVVSEVILAIVYFAVFLPVGLVFRLIGRDAMTRRFEPDARTYWSGKLMPEGREPYFRQW